MRNRTTEVPHLEICLLENRCKPLGKGTKVLLGQSKHKASAETFERSIHLQIFQQVNAVVFQQDSRLPPAYFQPSNFVRHAF